MSTGVVLLIVVAAIVLLALPFRKRSHVEQLLSEVDRTDEDEELAQAEEEVRDLGAMATPEDAATDLPDWGPGVPRKKRR